MRRFQIVLVILFVAILTALAWHVFKPQEPAYQGKSVNLWLDKMTNSFGFGTRQSFVEYSAAFREMGAQAVPYVFRRLEKNDSPLRNWWRDRWPKLPAFLQKLLPRPKPIDFDVMNTSMTLGYCGTNATPLIIEKVNHSNPAVREAAWSALSGSYVGKTLSTNQWITLCLHALNDPDAKVRLYAAMRLGHLGIAASNAVPAMIPLLSSSEAGRRPSERVFVRANTALALGMIGPAASNAVPALTNLMVTGDNYARTMAAIALWQITSNEIPVMPVLINELPSLNQNSKNLPINEIKNMGSRGKAAFPMLLKELPSAQDAHQRETITNALIAIDPEAAAKAGIKKTDVVTIPPTPVP